LPFSFPISFYIGIPEPPVFPSGLLISTFFTHPLPLLNPRKTHVLSRLAFFPFGLGPSHTNLLVHSPRSKPVDCPPQQPFSTSLAPPPGFPLARTFVSPRVGEHSLPSDRDTQLRPSLVNSTQFFERSLLSRMFCQGKFVAPFFFFCRLLLIEAPLIALKHQMMSVQGPRFSFFRTGKMSGILPLTPPRERVFDTCPCALLFPLSPPCSFRLHCVEHLLISFPHSAGSDPLSNSRVLL